MCKHFFCKMRTVLRMAFDVNCYAEEPCNINDYSIKKNILKYRSFAEHSDVIWT